LPPPASFSSNNVQLQEGLSTERSLYSTHPRTTFPVLFLAGRSAKWRVASFVFHPLSLTGSFKSELKIAAAALVVLQWTDGQDNGFLLYNSKESGGLNIVRWTAWQYPGPQILNTTSSQRSVAGRV
jgi:hypothetical protein